MRVGKTAENQIHFPDAAVPAPEQETAPPGIESIAR
jgi:hypothetical protein